MIEYELEINLKIKTDGGDFEDVYSETGNGPTDSLEEALATFVAPRIDAGKFILMRKANNKLMPA